MLLFVLRRGNRFGGRIGGRFGKYVRWRFSALRVFAAMAAAVSAARALMLLRRGGIPILAPRVLQLFQELIRG